MEFQGLELYKLCENADPFYYDIFNGKVSLVSLAFIWEKNVSEFYLKPATNWLSG